MAELPSKPTKIPGNQVLQFVVKEDTPGDFKLKTDATLSGMTEIDIDAQGGDNIAIADATSGQKAGVNASGELKTHDAEMLAKTGSSLVTEVHDYLAVTYVPSGNGVGEISTVVYKTGGSGGTTVATLTLAYNSDNKLISVTRS